MRQHGAAERSARRLPLPPDNADRQSIGNVRPKTAAAIAKVAQVMLIATGRRSIAISKLSGRDRPAYLRQRKQGHQHHRQRTLPSRKASRAPAGHAGHAAVDEHLNDDEPDQQPVGFHLGLIPFRRAVQPGLPSAGASNARPTPPRDIRPARAHRGSSARTTPYPHRRIFAADDGAFNPAWIHWVADGENGTESRWQTASRVKAGFGRQPGY